MNETLLTSWETLWPEALRCWSAYTQLREPLYFVTEADAAPHQMSGQLAAIRLNDQVVMVNLAYLASVGLQDCALQILAHEIGHHVYVPGNLNEHAKMLAVMKSLLFGLPNEVTGLCANLYSDLLINDRLQRSAGLDMAIVYQKLKEQSRESSPPKKKKSNEAEPQPENVQSQVWLLYTRTYEVLWRLPVGSLTPQKVSEDIEADAALLARLIRHYARAWLKGARRFASILYPYFVEDQKNKQNAFYELGLGDTKQAGQGEIIPDGLVGIDPSELDVDPDDSFERELRELLSKKRDIKVDEPKNTAPQQEGQGNPGQQCRTPFQFGELLRSLGMKLDEHAITTAYYRERAMPHLIPYPTRRAPTIMEPLAEAYETWDAGDAIEDLDIFGSMLRSPHMIPGITTVQRVYGETPGHEAARVPLDLDIYVDCSGSMPNPASDISYLALAGAILALSALRAGAKVQATLWSGAGQFETTKGFITDEKRILGTIAGYINGGTQFPIHVLRDTFAERPTDAKPVHIVVISDDGVTTMLDKDEKKQPGEDITKMALAKAKGGGTLVLNIPYANWAPKKQLEEIGFKVHTVTDWEQLISFARAFVREVYDSQ
jgi:hypothetical protein